MKRRHRRHSHSRKTILLSGIMALAVVAGLVFAVYQIRSSQDKYHVTAGNSVNMGSGYRNIRYKGKSYRYNALITTILYAGVDSFGTLDSDPVYSNKERADSIALVVLDKKHEKMSIIALNRDTMTDVRRYTRSGRNMGTYVTHLGYAYSYGDGGEVSCENLKEAVSSLLSGIPINEYVVTNMSSLVYLNRIAGGVTVTVPNNDLVELYPKLSEGVTVTLDDSNVLDYVHYRDTEKDFSNESRLERQKTFIDAYISKLRSQLRTEPEAVWNELEDIDDYMLTSITKNKYLDLVNLSRVVEYSEDDYYRPEGEDSAGALHDEFYIDEDALLEKVIELFYEEV